MGLWQRVKNLMRKEEKQADDRTRTVHNLRVGDFVTYDLEDYQVVGKLTYEDSGYRWTAYNLKGPNNHVWLSVEMDDEIELGIYRRVPTKLGKEMQTELELDGVTYYLEEEGSARIVTADGQVGATVGQMIQYWEYESDDEQYLSVEKWGSDLELNKGYTVSEYELKFLAGS